MNTRFGHFGQLAVALLAAINSIAIAGDRPAVKRSTRSKICHVIGSAGYEQTLHYNAFDSIEKCLKSGGRLPRKSLQPKSQLDPTKPAHPGDEGVLFGPLIRVIDGDTIVVKIQGAALRFRLSGIDAPEADQPFGDEARNELDSLINAQECVLVYDEGDIYRRLVAHLWIGDTYVNAEMVKRGKAWFDSESAQNSHLYDLEEEARSAKRGLWALPEAKRIPPWEWRHEQR